MIRQARYARPAMAIAALALGVGCAPTRITTTSRTAIEQALLSEAARRSLAEQNFERLAGSSYTIDAAGFEGVDSKFALSYLNQELLEGGLRQAAKPEEADLIVYPRTAYAGIDDTTFAIGVPELPIPLPGVGTISTPELSIFKTIRQAGRSRIEAHAVRTSDGSLAFTIPERAGSSKFTRWTLLFILAWRTTDLGAPF
jgi:hypothetical protein